MAMIQVTALELKNKANELLNLNDQFKGKTDDLEGKEQALCGMWEGQAKTAFHNAFTMDKQQMDVFRELILRYVQTLLEIASRYEQAEARNAEIASSRKSS